ncbi:hypothetical protein ACHAPV_005025 [Trichoderma viride]
MDLSGEIKPPGEDQEDGELRDLELAPGTMKTTLVHESDTEPSLNTATSAPVPQTAAPVQQLEPAHDLDFSAMDINPLSFTDVMNDFDLDSFLNDGDNGNEDFVFTGAYSGMESGDKSAE